MQIFSSWPEVHTRVMTLLSDPADPLPLPTIPFPPAPLTLLAYAQAAFQLQQGDGPVLIQVAVVGELAGAFLGFGFLLQVPLKRLELLLVDVVAAVVIQLGEVPVHHPLLQSVTGIRLNKPGQRNT